jgi:hypothetical protein
MIMWRETDNDELHNLYLPPDITRVIKSRKMTWEGHVAGITGRRRYTYNILVWRFEKPTWKNQA